MERYRTLDELLKELPPGYLKEVRDFVEFLLEKERKKSRKRLRLSCEGALKDLGNVDPEKLQTFALKWRVNKFMICSQFLDNG